MRGWREISVSEEGALRNQMSKKPALLVTAGNTQETAIHIKTCKKQFSGSKASGMAWLHPRFRSTWSSIVLKQKKNRIE